MSLFDRINGVKAEEDIDWKDEAVDIYSVVYDDQKSGILYNESSSNKGNLLRNYKNIPYHIHFIGGMSTQFDYQNIYDADLEKSAYHHHAGWVDVEKDPETAKKEKNKYEQYEYYRLSSISKELYQREIKSNSVLSLQTECTETEKQPTCKCENCIRRKKSEHMRWNAYTRVIGFSHSKTRADRALLHDKLCVWEGLSEHDRLKD